MGPKRSEGFMAKAKGYPIVLVEWADSVVERSAWNDRETDPKHYQPGVCRSVGWLLDKDDVRVVLLGDTSDTQHGRHMTIPLGCVTSIKTLVKA